MAEEDVRVRLRPKDYVHPLPGAILVNDNRGLVGVPDKRPVRRVAVKVLRRRALQGLPTHD